MEARELINRLKAIRADVANHEVYDAVWELSRLIRELARESGVKLDEEEEKEWDEDVS